jgi:AcrR family transcriptional regulator
MTSDDSTRQQILDAAYRLFIERGFQGSSMRDIADRAGIKAASIYNHFDGKESIFKEIFIEKHPLFGLLEVLNRAKGKTAEELLTSAFELLSREIKNEPKLLNLYFVELVEMDGKHVQEAILTNFPHDSDFMHKIFELKSELRDIRDPVLVRILIGTVLANVMFNWFVGDVNSKRWGSSAEMTDVLLRGILKPSS